MKAKTYYIIRHSETFVTQSKRWFRTYGFKIFTAHILPIGRPTTEKLARYLKKVPTDCNLCSEFRRCKETANIISKITGKNFKYDKRLNENVFEPAWYFRRRIKRLIKELESSEYERILICTHSVVIVALIKLLSGEHFTFKDFFINSPPPGILTIIKNGKVKVLDFNQKES